MKVAFEMTDEQLEGLMNECKPVVMIALQCGTSSSLQENANRAWASLGNVMGFKPMTVEPIRGKSTKHFMAVQINKCDSCNFDTSTCKSGVVKFGQGKGHDNVIECDGYIELL